MSLAEVHPITPVTPGDYSHADANGLTPMPAQFAPPPQGQSTQDLVEQIRTGQVTPASQAHLAGQVDRSMILQGVEGAGEYDGGPTSVQYQQAQQSHDYEAALAWQQQHQQQTLIAQHQSAMAAQQAAVVQAQQAQAQAVAYQETQRVNAQAAASIAATLNQASVEASQTTGQVPTTHVVMQEPDGTFAVRSLPGIMAPPPEGQRFAPQPSIAGMLSPAQPRIGQSPPSAQTIVETIMNERGQANQQAQTALGLPGVPRSLTGRALSGFQPMHSG